MTAVVLGGVAAFWAVRRGVARPALVGLAVWLLVSVPVLAAAGGFVWFAVHRWRRASARTRRSRDADDDRVVMADLVALGLEAGLTVRRAIETAGRYVHDDLGDEAVRLVSRMDRVGTAPALIGWEGRLGELSTVVASAVTSGAPVAAAVAAHADHERHLHHTARVEVARRLPVRLLLPLALLILPGFVVLAVGPAVLQALARLAPVP